MSDKFHKATDIFWREAIDALGSLLVAEYQLRYDTEDGTAEFYLADRDGNPIITSDDGSLASLVFHMGMMNA